MNHRNKPEWDVVPTIVKEDIFFAKATIDDLEALKLVPQNAVDGGANENRMRNS